MLCLSSHVATNDLHCRRVWHSNVGAQSAEMHSVVTWSRAGCDFGSPLVRQPRLATEPRDRVAHARSDWCAYQRPVGRALAGTGTGTGCNADRTGVE